MTNYNLNINNPQEIATEIIKNTNIIELETANNSDFPIALINGISVEFYKLYNKLNYARNILDPSQLNGKTLKDWRRLANYYGVNYYFKRAETLKITVKNRIDQSRTTEETIQRLSHKLRYDGNDYMLSDDVVYNPLVPDNVELNYFKYDGLGIINREIGAYDIVVLNNTSIYENRVFVFIDNGTTYQHFDNLSFEQFIIRNNNESNTNNQYFTLKKDVNGFYNVNFSHKLSGRFNVSIVYFTYSDNTILEAVELKDIIIDQTDLPTDLPTVSNQYTYSQSNIINFTNFNPIYFNIRTYDLNLFSGVLADTEEQIYNNTNIKLTNISPLLTKSFIENYLAQQGYVYYNVENFFNNVRIFTESLADDNTQNTIQSITWPNTATFEIFEPINIGVEYNVILGSGVPNDELNTNPISLDIKQRTTNINRRQRLDLNDLVFLAKQNPLVDDVSVSIRVFDDTGMAMNLIDSSRIQVNFDKIIVIQEDRINISFRKI